MKKATEAPISASLIKFGKKNRACRFLTIPILAVIMFFTHLISYIGKNGKRLCMLPLSCCLFVVYSSFSFPIFITEDAGVQEGLLVNSELVQNVSLADETEVDFEDLELLDDNDVLEEDEFNETSHGMDIVDKYDASEILQSSEDRVQRDSSQSKAVDAETTVFSKDDWRLVLINKQHSIPEDYTFTLGTIKGSMKCDERIIDDLLDMLQAAKEDDMNLIICSPYRDMERQVMLFNRKVTRYMDMGMSYMEAYNLASQAVTVPGASEHQIGLALDIVSNTYTYLDEGFGDTDEGKWLAENSCRFGFILRYPKGKEFITGIEYEPWHFRYVGIEAATAIMQEGITLEEFWEDLE